MRNASAKTIQPAKNWHLLAGEVVVLHVELKAMLHAAILTEFLIPATVTVKCLKLPAKIFKKLCIGSSAFTFQAGESIRKQLGMTKAVPGCQVSKWSFGSTGRTAALWLGSSSPGCCPTGPETNGLPGAHGKARTLSVTSPATEKTALPWQLCYELFYV